MSAPVRRIKVTIPPPKVCGSKCWWRAKYARMVRAYKKLRRDYIELSSKHNASKRMAADDDRDAEPDVLEMIG